MNMAALPDWSILFAIKQREDDFKLFSQVGAHQTLHLNEEMVAACWDWGVFLSMTVLHLDSGINHRNNHKVQAVYMHLFICSYLLR